MFDPADYTFDIKDIKQHMHRNLKVPETLEMQRRLKRKWEYLSCSLHETTSTSFSLIEAWQLQRIAFLVDLAFTHHPFYHQLYKSAGYKRGDIVSWDDYHKLPTISKKDIIDNYESFTTANLGPSIKECYTARTSGSSGQILTVIEDSVMVEEHMLRFFRFYDQILGRPRRYEEWLYDIYIASPPFSSIDGNFPTFTVSNDCPIESVLEHISLIKPTILNGFPSYLERLGAIVPNPMALGIKGIITNSESSTEQQRAKISKFFGAPVFDEYSSIELSLIATQCVENRYHIVEDNVRVDVLSPDQNGIGEIIATNLNNTFMPFIRYRQGDTIKIGDSGNLCLCGNKFRHLHSFWGRIDQFLYSKNIGRIPPDRIMSLYDRTLILAKANIDEFQIIQKRLGEVELLLVALDKSKEIDKDILLEFSDSLKDIFQEKDLSIIVKNLVTMPPEKSHKRRLIKCEIAS